jgi:hypothetical protein
MFGNKALTNKRYDLMGLLPMTFQFKANHFLCSKSKIVQGLDEKV